MNCTLRVLMVEDSEADAALVVRELQQAGYLVDALRVEEERTFLEALQTRTWDVVTCNHSPAKFNSTDALRLINDARLDLPLLLLSREREGESSVEAVVSGFPGQSKAGEDRLAANLKQELAKAMLRRASNRTELDLQFRGNLLDSLGQAIVATDLGTRVTYWNRPAEELYGWAASEALNRNLLELIVPKSLWSRAQSQLARIQDGRRWSGEMEFCRRGGEPLVVLVTYAPVRDMNLGIIGAIGVSNDITQQKRAETELRSSRQQLRALAARLETVREEERTLIARDLHDELGQALTGLKFDLAWMRSRLRTEPPELAGSLQGKIAEMGSLIDSTSNTVRALCTSLRPAALDDLGLVAAIEWQVGEFAKRTGLICEFTEPPGLHPLDLSRASSIFRIFQELLTNVARHAKARRVMVSLEETECELILKVTDDGRGIRDDEIHAANSFGLVGMRERALALGGCIEFQAAPGRGTQAWLRLPINP